MKRVGLRRWFPRLSKLLRWALVNVALAERDFARLPPDEQLRLIDGTVLRGVVL